jgi:hypothetical protein
VNRKLLPEDVAEMRERYSRGENYRELMRRFRVAQATVYAAVKGRTHRDVTAVPPCQGSNYATGPRNGRSKHHAQGTGTQP